MIQDFSLNIETTFNTLDFNFFNEPVFSQIEKIEHHCLNNINASSLHTACITTITTNFILPLYLEFLGGSLLYSKNLIFVIFIKKHGNFTV